MSRWLRQLLCRHIYVTTPHWLLDTNGQKIGKVGLLVCAECGHCSLSGIHLLAERAKGECPHAARCDCLGGCKRGMRGNGAVEVKP